MNYFDELLGLLKIEKDEDKQSYISFAQNTSVSQRRALGFTWYPIVIKDEEIGIGDYLNLEIERPSNTDIIHQFRFGVSARLFSQNNPKQDYVDGVVTWQSANKLKLSLRIEELPEWADNGKLGVDLLFDDNSYYEMEQALKKAKLKAEEKEGTLARILSGTLKPTFQEHYHTAAIATLNESQNEAVKKILAANELAIVHGPPGTGKTTTLVQAIKQLAKKEGKILVTAPSNAAVDLLSEKLSEAGLEVLRVGNPVRVSERLQTLTLDSKIAIHSSTKEIKKLKKQAAEFKNMAHKYKRKFGKAEREQRKALFQEARRIMKNAENTEQYIIADVVAKTQVITSTLVGANHHTVRQLQYHTVVIDEAGQALEPACWIPTLKGEKLILAGDHCQLPPTVKSEEAARAGLGNTLLEKNIALHPEAVVLLNEQYRMNKHIMQYSSDVFYEGQLRAHHSVAEHLLYDGDEALKFIDTAGCGFEEEEEQTSLTNPEEAVLLLKILEQQTQALAQYYTPENFPKIGIISPYKKQVEYIKTLLTAIPALTSLGDSIVVNTIDSFQGQEKDIIYISLTRSNDKGIVGFLSDIRRMNVAMTRAKKKLIIIGDSATLSQHKFYEAFINHTQESGAYYSAWEWMDL